MLKELHDSDRDEDSDENPMEVEEFVRNSLSIAQINDRMQVTSRMLFLYGVSAGRAMFNSELTSSLDIEKELTRNEVLSEMDKVSLETKFDELNIIESGGDPNEHDPEPPHSMTDMLESIISLSNMMNTRKKKMEADDDVDMNDPDIRRILEELGFDKEDDEQET